MSKHSDLPEGTELKEGEGAAWVAMGSSSPLNEKDLYVQ